MIIAASNETAHPTTGADHDRATGHAIAAAVTGIAYAGTSWVRLAVGHATANSVRATTRKNTFMRDEKYRRTSGSDSAGMARTSSTRAEPPLRIPALMCFIIRSPRPSP